MKWMNAIAIRGLRAMSEVTETTQLHDSGHGQSQALGHSF